MHKRMMVFMALVFALFSCARVEAQYRLLAGELDKDEISPGTPARICLGTKGTAHCYSPPSTKDYVFGLEPKAESAGKLDGQPLTLFSAMFSDGGSGTLTEYSLLTVRKGEFVNLLPKVRLTNQSELKLWRLSEISTLPVVVTADFIWDFKAEETHFSEHRYAIEAFVFDKESGAYSQQVEYSTTGKYVGLDGSDEGLSVLEGERARILAKLYSSKRNKP
jgi:hypothetical protein